MSDRGRCHGVVEGTDGCKAATGKMDPEIWSRLPEEQLLDVLARLPTNYIPRLREVCKKWKYLLVAKRFTDRITSVPTSQTPFLLVCIKDYQAIAAYNPARKAWREIVLWKQSPAFQIHCLRATGGGLLCFKGNRGERRSDDVREIRLLVCNPFTKRWRILPALPPGIRTSGCVNVIVLENEPNQFKVRRPRPPCPRDPSLSSSALHTEPGCCPWIYIAMMMMLCVGDSRLRFKRGTCA